MSISMIRGQEPQRVVDSGHDLSGEASMLDGLIGEQVRAANRMRESWFGRAATAAAAKAYRNIQQEYLEHEKVVALAAAMQSGGGATARHQKSPRLTAAQSMERETGCRSIATSPVRW